MPAGTRFDCYAALLRCFAPPVSGRSIADPDPRGATRASHVQRCPEEWNTLEAERLEASRPEANGEERMCLICYEEKDDVIVIPHLNLIAGNIKDHRACASCLQAWGRAECPFARNPSRASTLAVLVQAVGIRSTSVRPITTWCSTASGTTAAPAATDLVANFMDVGASTHQQKMELLERRKPTSTSCKRWSTWYQVHSARTHVQPSRLLTHPTRVRTTATVRR